MGALIAIEGIDGAGKGTQTDLLRARAEREGVRCELFSFPQYGANAFAEGVSAYLNGAFGPLENVPAQLAALLYAGDRYATRPKLIDALAASDLVVCDRYIASNLAYQAAKLPPNERDAFIAWISEIELGLYAMPLPDLTFLLDVPVPQARELVRRKRKRDYTELVEDIHESDAAFLEASRGVFAQLASERRLGAWQTIDCSLSEESLLPAEEIAEQIWSSVSSALATRPQ
jgi:dTMP kinase